MSGLRVIWTTSGKTSHFPKSTSMFQPVVPPRIDDPTLRFCNVGFAVDEPTLRFCNVGCAVCVFLVSPDLQRQYARVGGYYHVPFSAPSANSLRTESCLHRYLPCVSAVEQDDKTCSRVPGLSHRLHLGSVVSPHRHRFVGDGSRS